MASNGSNNGNMHEQSDEDEDSIEFLVRGRGQSATQRMVGEFLHDSIASLNSQFSNRSGSERQVLRSNSLPLSRRSADPQNTPPSSSATTTPERPHEHSPRHHQRRNSEPFKTLSQEEQNILNGMNRADGSSRTLPYESSVPILYLLDAIGRDSLNQDQRRSSLRHMLDETLNSLALDDGIDLL
jgi:hypothetical protein